MNEVITKAELARELDLSRARVSQLCKIGLPVRPDGRLNRAEALAWVKANVCSWRGGWWGDIRQKPNARRGRVQDELAETAEGCGDPLHQRSAADREYRELRAHGASLRMLRATGLRGGTVVRYVPSLLLRPEGPGTGTHPGL
jgi:hypothetical protein